MVKSFSLKTPGRETVFTSVDIAPDALVERLYAQGYTMIVIADTHHPEWPIDQLTTGLLQSEKSRPDTYFAELDHSYQSRYDNYATNPTLENTCAFHALVANPRDAHAPGEETPEWRQEYFDTHKALYETTRENGIKVGFIDSYLSQDADKSNEAVEIHNQGVRLEHNFRVMRAFFKNGKLQDIRAIPDKEFEDLLNQIGEAQPFFYEDDVYRYSHTVKLKERETLSDKRDQLLKMKDYYLHDIGASENDSEMEMREKAQKKYTHIEGESEKRKHRRDAARDEHMHQNIQSFAGQHPSQRMMMQIGQDHVDARGNGRGDNEKNLMERMQDAPNINPVRIDVRTVEQSDLERMGKLQTINGVDCVVSMGGEDNADYTIFVTGKNATMIINSQKSVVTPEDHEKRLKELEKTVLDKHIREALQGVGNQISAAGHTHSVPSLSPVVGGMGQATTGRSYS